MVPNIEFKQQFLVILEVKPNFWEVVTPILFKCSGL